MRLAKQKIITSLASSFMGRYTKKHLNLKSDAKGLPLCTETKKYLLYIHVPFCTLFCPYCSFHKFKFTQETSTEYFKYLRQEILHVKQLGYDFDNLVIGGGTPLIDEDELIETIKLAKSLFSIETVTCETDPNYIQPKTIKKLKGLVDRISVGVQSFDDEILKKLGRYDKFGSAKKITKDIKAMLGILPITSVDLIFNFPGQTSEGLDKDLKTLIKLAPEQTSFYPLMTSPYVKNDVKQTLGKFSLENEYKFFNQIKNSLKEAFPVRHGWAFSKANTDVIIDEYVIDNDEYVGVGSGSFSFLNNVLYVNEFSLEKYSQDIIKKGCAVTKKKVFPDSNKMYYRLMVGLYNGKLYKEKFFNEFNVSIDKALKKELLLLKMAGAIHESIDTITTTEFGDYLSVVLMKEFYMGMDHIRDSSRKAIGAI